MKASPNYVPEEITRKSSKMILKKNSNLTMKYNLSNFEKEKEKNVEIMEGGFEDIARKNSSNLMLKWRKSIKKQQEGGGGMSPVANRYFAKEIAEEKPMLKLMVFLSISLFLNFIYTIYLFNLYSSRHFYLIS